MLCQVRSLPAGPRAREPPAQPAQPYGADVMVGLPQRVAPIRLHAREPDKYRAILAFIGLWHARCLG
ncbi:MAG: hypothetical protein RL385_3043 [Pseudomonadota bacterium]|jgi:hypothetical protein